MENEQEIIEKLPTTYNKYFIPLAWATSLVARARKEGRIKDDFAVKTLIDVSDAFPLNRVLYQFLQLCTCQVFVD